MKIYVVHSSKFDYKKELYVPIRESALNSLHEFIFPHEYEKENELFDTKNLYRSGCDLIIAEVSYPSFGIGIELGWAEMYKIPVVCIHIKGIKPSSALSVVTDKFIEYESTEDLIKKIGEFLDSEIIPKDP
jgi:hypothetical protein